MITVIHKDCGGPALEPESMANHERLKNMKELFIICLTCLDEIRSPDELIFGEDRGQ
jgi:hypothetical protein